MALLRGDPPDQNQPDRWQLCLVWIFMGQ